MVGQEWRYTENQMFRRVLVLAAFLSLFLSGCGVSRNDVIGKYHLNNRPNTSASLEIQADGTYVQRIEIKGQTPVTAEGKWEFIKGDNNPLRLQDAYYFDFDGDRLLKGGVAFPIEKAAHWIVLVVSPDEGVGYMKD
jgi:hypothetical protein